MLWGCCGEIWGWKRYGVVMGLGSLWGCYGARVGLENATGLETVWGFYREMWGYYGAVVGLRNAGALPGGFYGAGEWRTLRALLWGGVCCGVRECSGAGNALGGCVDLLAFWSKVCVQPKKSVTCMCSLASYEVISFVQPQSKLQLRELTLTFCLSHLHSAQDKL